MVVRKDGQRYDDAHTDPVVKLEQKFKGNSTEKQINQVSAVSQSRFLSSFVQFSALANKSEQLLR